MKRINRKIVRSVIYAASVILLIVLGCALTGQLGRLVAAIVASLRGVGLAVVFVIVGGLLAVAILFLSDFTDDEETDSSQKEPKDE